MSTNIYAIVNGPPINTVGLTPIRLQENQYFFYKLLALGSSHSLLKLIHQILSLNDAICGNIKCENTTKLLLICNVSR